MLEIECQLQVITQHLTARFTNMIFQHIFLWEGFATYIACTWAYVTLLTLGIRKMIVYGILWRKNDLGHGSHTKHFSIVSPRKCNINLFLDASKFSPFAHTWFFFSERVSRCFWKSFSAKRNFHKRHTHTVSFVSWFGEVFSNIIFMENCFWDTSHTCGLRRVGSKMSY